MDLKFIRENSVLVKELLKRRGEKDTTDEILTLDQKRRRVQQARDNLRAELKQISKKIAEKKEKQLREDARKISDKIKELELELDKIETGINELVQYIPNIIHSSVPDSDQVIAEWGKIPEFNFEPLPHWELGEALKIIDLKRAAKLAGSRFVLFKGLGAQLERALINFCLEHHIRHHKYQEISPPALSLKECFYNTGALPKLASEMFQCVADPFYLIPTAEVPLVNLHRDEVLSEESLPFYYCAYTPCFRREAGSYGRDVRGMIRIHQFDKVELVKFTLLENSYDELEKMRQDIEEIMQLLQIPYRVKLLSAKAMAFQSAKTYDIDAWAAGCKSWLEVSSVSNCEDFQARRANIKVRRKNGNLEYVHILNGSGLAFPRIFVALVENNQTKDGRIIVPEVLRPYMNGIKEIA